MKLFLLLALLTMLNVMDLLNLINSALPEMLLLFFFLLLHFLLFQKLFLFLFLFFLGKLFLELRPRFGTTFLLLGVAEKLLELIIVLEVGFANLWRVVAAHSVRDRSHSVHSEIVGHARHQSFLVVPVIGAGCQLVCVAVFPCHAICHRQGDQADDAKSTQAKLE